MPEISTETLDSHIILENQLVAGKFTNNMDKIQILLRR